MQQNRTAAAGEAGSSYAVHSPATSCRACKHGSMLLAGQRACERVRHEDAVAVAALHGCHACQLHVPAALPGRRYNRHHVAGRQLARQDVGPGLGPGQRRLCCSRRALTAPCEQVVAGRDCSSKGPGGG